MAMAMGSARYASVPGWKQNCCNWVANVPTIHINLFWRAIGSKTLWIGLLLLCTRSASRMSMWAGLDLVGMSVALDEKILFTY